MAEVRIVCTKEQFADMVTRCYSAAHCYGCIMEAMCGVSSDCARMGAVARLTEQVEIKTDKLKGEDHG